MLFFKYPYMECPECPVFLKNHQERNDQIDDFVEDQEEVCSAKDRDECRGGEDYEDYL